jgi:CRP/FNR family cyclic AMP-dependent transcriptional regulator
MAVDVDLVASLARLGIFADMSRPEIEELLQTVDEVEFPEGQWVVRRGEMGSHFYIIVDGEVGVMIDDEERTTLSKGSFFGEVSLLLGEAATADVVTRTPLRCLAVPAEKLEDFLVAHPRVTFRVLKTEARRLRTADQRRA